MGGMGGMGEMGEMGGMGGGQKAGKRKGGGGGGGGGEGLFEGDPHAMELAGMPSQDTLKKFTHLIMFYAPW